VFYDADCRFCRGWAERTRDLLLRRGYHLVPLQAAWVIAKLRQVSVPLPAVNSNEAANESGGPIGSQSAPTFSLSAVGGGEGRGEVAPYPISTPMAGLSRRSEAKAEVRASIPLNAPLSEMKLLTTNGRILGGADAFIRLTRAIWWAWPVFILAQIPGLKPLMRIIYRSIARNRHCLGNHCRVPGSSAKHHRHLTSSFYEFP
jgi:predicted DCC family thiol-disulfide oxidoreductase YuxK